MLVFCVDVEEVVKVKLTVMVGDGRREAIYGTGGVVFMMEELREQQLIHRKDLELRNFTDTFVGKCNLAF